MKILTGRELVAPDAQALTELRARHAQCLFDVGTGDGLFPYHWARRHPEDLAVGLDPVADALARLAVKSRRKPAKGGTPNLLLAVGPVEELPGPFAGWADQVTVNFPWGSLLRALVLPEPAVLRKLSALARRGAEILVLLNTTIFQDGDYSERLGLPPLSTERAEEQLSPVYRSCGILLERIEPLAGGVPHRTSWGQRLVLGSSRSTLLLAGSFAEPTPTDTGRNFP